MNSEPTPPSGTTGAIAAANITRLRADQRFTYAALARELAAIGNPIPELGIRRLERGERRIDVDDLVAFARVFKVNPIDLLLAVPGDDPTEPPAVAIVKLSIDGRDPLDKMFADFIRRFIQTEVSQ